MLNFFVLAAGLIGCTLAILFVVASLLCAFKKWYAGFFKGGR